MNPINFFNVPKEKVFPVMIQVLKKEFPLIWKEFETQGVVFSFAEFTGHKDSPTKDSHVFSVGVERSGSIFIIKLTQLKYQGSSDQPEFKSKHFGLSISSEKIKKIITQKQTTYDILKED